MLTTGDKILYAMKDAELGIVGLSELSGVRKNDLLNFMAGIKEPDLCSSCRIADALGMDVSELRADEETYMIAVEKDILAKLIVISEINGVDMNDLIDSILEKGIEEHGFYE